MIKIPYTTHEEKEDIIKAQLEKGLILIEEANITEGNFLVFASELPIPKLSEFEKLQQENAMLQMSVMELSTYTALQDERLQGQEQAILELSMLVAGGGA